MAFWDKEEKKPTALETVNNKLTQALQSDKAQKGISALKAGLTSVDDAEGLRDLWEDQNGKFNADILKNSLARTLASSSYANQMYDKALNSQYGSMADQLSRAPKLALKIKRKNDVASIALKGFNDRADERRFQAAKAQTLSGMSQTVNELALKHQQATQKATGYNAVANALRTQGTMKFGKKGFDPDFLLEQADKEHYMATGQHLTDEEKQYAWDALKKGYKRGYAKKGLAIVYNRKRGGIAGQRIRAAADTVGRNAEQVGLRAQMIGGALGEANEKINKVMEMQGTDKRIRGPKFNIDRFKNTYNALEKQREEAATKKSAAEAPTLLTALSDTGFASRPIGKTRVLVRRTLDEDGGMSQYADAVIHSQGNQAVSESEIMSLKTALKKLYRERAFLDDIDFSL